MRFKVMDDEGVEKWLTIEDARFFLFPSIIDAAPEKGRKRCKSCDLEKPFDEFLGLNRKSKFGKCKDCAE